MDLNNKYWKGIEEAEKHPEFVSSKKNEFAEALPLEEVLNATDLDLSSNRRDFLKYFGFSVSAVALAACQKTQVKYAIPYVVNPENVTPGNANYYASTCGGCNTGCGILVKTREGRPIKLDGNELSPISKGALCATGQASILSLYDINRLANPVKNGNENENWGELDKEIIAKLEGIVASGGKITIVTGSSKSPSLAKALEVFKAKYAGTEVVAYDPISYSGILLANEKSFGKRALPSYNFDKADVIVSFGADFLGTWISPVEYTKQWVTKRNPKDGKLSKHYQFESILSLTGSNADVRVPMKESKEGIYLISLYNEIARQMNGSQIPVAQKAELAGNSIEKAAKDLVAASGRSLVVSKSNVTEHQILVNAINLMLGNYGAVIDMNNHSNQSNFIESDFEQFVSNLSSGSVKGVIFMGTNPVYSYHNSSKLVEGLKKASLVVTTSEQKDETSEVAGYICPDSHFLESWGDSEPKKGLISFTQPTISKVFNTRQAIESILIWAGLSAAEADAYTFIKSSYEDIDVWNKSVHDGVIVSATEESATPSFSANVNEAAEKIVSGSSKSDSSELIVYQKVGVKDGNLANNPWLHETPDPISKVCYDNYLSVSKSEAEKNDLKQNDVVNISLGNKKIENIPVLIQPGQATGTYAIALGYGRTQSGKVGKNLGKNAYPLLMVKDGNTLYNYQGSITVEKTGEKYVLAQTQTHHTIEGRDYIREATLEEFKKNPYVRNDHKIDLVTLWQEYDYTTGHKWGMAIDLNACTGCGACIVSCHIENNVPVVGRDEIRLRREMHWMRIDRYYSFYTPEQYLTKEKEIESSESTVYDNIRVVHAPMMCQHCEHAPCETVCPVLATTHSTEGLNQMTYNRCIGTKYCGNNCPYKVRRFNWFRYNDNDNFDNHFNNDLGKMVINPDVTVRTRGVMEKCSFCVQRIQAGKLSAKREGRKVKDGDIKTACATACPSNAIVFGDMNDPESEISKLYKNERSYHMLEEVGIKPSVSYLTKIRNV
ncbi:MAG: TAT-variant-translocated molybdopterin oxidoreductase [Flavobacteriales bacterium]|nr:TAT-variant-translocated molybdopterin oxidoreductase [Flavobacteriales bacterium]